MNKPMVRESLDKREILFREIFVWSWELLRERLPQYIILTIIVFLPSNLLVTMLIEQIPETIDMTQYMKVSGLQLLANLFAMIACSVCVVMVDDQLSEGSEQKSFGTVFYEGIRTWPMFFITTLVLMAAMVGVIFVITILSSFLTFLVVPAMVAMIILALLLVVFMYGSNVMAARHRIMLKRNIDLVRASIKDHMGKTIGLILLVSIIGIGLSAPLMTFFETLIGDRLTGIPLIIIETLLQTVLSIINIYANITVCLRFTNLELIRPDRVRETFV